MPFALAFLDGGTWDYNSGTGQASLYFPAGIVLPQGHFTAQLQGFVPGTTYYAAKVQIPGFMLNGTPGQTYAATDASSSLGPAVAEPTWYTGEGLVTRELTISFPGPTDGGAINNATISVTVVAGGPGNVIGRTFGFNSTVTGEPRFNVIGSTNPADGGQTPPDPIKLSVSPSGTVSVLQNQILTLNAVCASDSGVFYDPMNFTLTVVTPGLGLFVPNGLDFINRPNNPGQPGMQATDFAFAAGFTGLGQIRCDNGYATNGSQYWTFNVQAPVVASGGEFDGMMLFPG